MQELINLFKDIKVHKAIILCISALSIVLPAVLFLYEFIPAVFSYDGFKMQLFAAAISFGLLLLLFFIFCLYLFEPVDKQLIITEKTIWLALLFASLFSSAELYSISFIKMWAGAGFKAPVGISICIGINLFLLVDSIRDFKERKMELKST